MTFGRVAERPPEGGALDRPPAFYDPRMLHYGPRIGMVGLVALGLALTVSGAALSRPGLEIGGALLIVLALVGFLVGRP